MIYKRCWLLLLVLYLFCCATPLNAIAQSYGLGFFSHETVLDKRTGLDLSPGKTLCFKSDFELSFDFAFLPDRENYFGYIVRLIDNDRQNIDLLYDRRTDDEHFKLIIGDKISNIFFNLDEKKLLNGWTRFVIKFDVARQQLTFSVGKSSFRQKIRLQQNNCLKVLFGANDYLDFKTNDTPPMRLRNISIAEAGKPLYNWTLEQSDGDTALDNIKGSVAQVVNPLWIKKLHCNWQLVQTIKVKGTASVAFSRKDETVYLVSADSLITYKVPSGKRRAVKYLSGSQYLLDGNQSLYSDELGTLLNINIDRKEIARYDTAARTWNLKHGTTFFETNYWHANKFYSPLDSSLYVIGGYGQFYYRKDVQRFHLPNNKWSKIKLQRDNFIPRYLAALGAVDGGAYIIGGYGSLTGQQILNPRNLYDLLYFDVKSKSFKKLYDLNVHGEDFVFANSMVVSQKEKSFYALIFPKHKYNSNLRLVEGSLEKPELKELADQIPYTFHDIKSFADLFYCPKSKRFIVATTFLNDKDETTINLYSLYSPPIPPVKANASLAGRDNRLLWWLIGGSGLLVLAVGGFWLSRKRHPKLPAPMPVPEIMPVDKPDVKAIEPVLEAPIVNNQEKIKNAIFLFGDLQLFDREGQDLTRNLTPLTKELFLIILLYTIRWGRGITSEKLKEILWFDKSAESARNNRSVNIAKLKNMLDKMDACQIMKESGHWKVVFDESKVKVDYKTYLDIVKANTQLDKRHIDSLSAIIQRGNFLPDAEYEWLDTFKSEISNEIIDTYLKFASTLNIKDEPELMIKVASYVFYFDPVNEEAMTKKCKSLIALGKHSLAKNTYDSFCKEYRTIYGEDYYKEYHAVIE